MKLVKKPLRISVWKRTWTLSVPSLKINLSAINKFSKKIFSNSDVLPVILDLTMAKCEDGDIYNNYRESVSLIGILRGLQYLKYFHPEAYREFLDIARYLSFELEEEKIPPLTFLSTSKYVSDAFEIMKKKYGIELEDYIYAVVLGFQEGQTKCSQLKDVSLFFSDYEKDEKEIREILTSRIDDIPLDVLCEIDASLDIESNFLHFAYEEEVLNEIEQIFGSLNEELQNDKQD